MIGKLLALVALSSTLTNTVVQADEWGKVVELADSIIYVRFPTPDFHGQPVKVWSLQDFKKPYVTAGQTWRSRVKLEEYDCANDQTTTKEVIFYEQNMGREYPVQSLHLNDTDAVVPGSVGEAMFRATCKG